MLDLSKIATQDYEELANHGLLLEVVERFHYANITDTTGGQFVLNDTGWVGMHQFMKAQHMAPIAALIARLTV